MQLKQRTVEPVAGTVHSRKVQRLYDEYFSRHYDKHMRATGHYATMERILRELRRRGVFGGRILDPTCGTGEALRMMREMFGADARFLIGNDFSMEMLHRARRKLGNETMLTAFDARDIRMLDASVGTVFCSYSFHWFLDKERIAQEFHRMLVPGGTLVCVEEFPFTVTNSRYMPRRMKRLIQETVEKTKMQGLDELLHMLRGVGFGYVDLLPEKIDARHDMYGVVLQKQQG